MLYRIQACYGDSGWTPVNGGVGGDLYTITLAFAELITAFKATTRLYNNENVLCSITFYTSARTYGPYSPKTNSIDQGCMEDWWGGATTWAVIPRGVAYFAGAYKNYLVYLEFYTLAWPSMTSSAPGSSTTPSIG